jgi:hypothetical protein
MPHSIDTLLVHLKDTLKEFGVSDETSVEIGATTLIRVLDALYYANHNTLMQHYVSNLDFRQAALNQGLLYEQWLRPQLGLPPVRSFPEDDALIEGLANHLGDLLLAINTLKGELGYQGVGGRRSFIEVDASVARACSFLQQYVEGETISEALPPTRFEREPVL